MRNLIIMLCAMFLIALSGCGKEHTPASSAQQAKVEHQEHGDGETKHEDH